MVTLDKPAVDLDISALDVPEPELHCDGIVEEGGVETPCVEPVTHRAVLSCGHHYLICDTHVEWCRIILAEDGNTARYAACPGGPWVSLTVLEPIK